MALRLTGFIVLTFSPTIPTGNDMVPLPKGFTDCIYLNHVGVSDLNTSYPYLPGEDTGSRGTGQPSDVIGT